MSDENDNRAEKLVINKIKEALVELDGSGDIVLCSSSPNQAAEFLYRKLENFALCGPHGLSVAELSGLRSLVFHAIRDRRFFDFEMPTLTGFDAEDFRKIAEKLPSI